MALKIRLNGKKTIYANSVISECELVSGSLSYDSRYDYNLGNGYAVFIGVPADLGMKRKIGLFRLSDANEPLTFAKDDNGIYKIPISIVSGLKNIQPILDDELAVVMFNIKNPSDLKIARCVDLAVLSPDAFWAIYRQNVLNYMGKTSNLVVAQSRFDSRLFEWLDIQSQVPDIATRIKKYINNVINKAETADGKEMTDKQVIDILKELFNPTTKKKQRETIPDIFSEPTWIPFPVPFKSSNPKAADNTQFNDYMRIGYTELSIPPDQIKSSRTSSNKSTNTLRSNGSNQHRYGNSDVEYYIHMIMEDINDINNVLLPIIRQVEKEPFLPIDNYVFNDVFDCDAVAVTNINVSTVPGFPNALDVTIRCERFNWETYIFELSSFSDGFNYPLMKLWCENPEKTDTRPIGWDAESGTPAMNGRFEMYIPNEKWLNLVNKELYAQLLDSPSATQAAKDKANLKNALQYVKQGASSRIFDIYSAKGSSRYPIDSLLLYSALSIPASCLYKKNSTMPLVEIGSQKYIYYGTPSAAIKVKDPKAARAMLLEMTKHNISSKSTDYGVFVTNEGGTIVSQPYGGVSAYIMAGTVYDPEFLYDRLKSEMYDIGNSVGYPMEQSEQAVSSGRPSQILDAMFSGGYFILPVNSKSAAVLKAGIDSIDNSYGAAEALDNEDMFTGTGKIKEAWDRLDLNSLEISSISVESSNMITTLLPQGQSYPNHQYLGKMDATVTMQGTVSMKDAGYLREFLDRQDVLSVQYGGIGDSAVITDKDGKSINLTGGYAGFMLLKNEICRLMGITHVLPVECIMNTIEGQPDLYEIAMKFVQFDPLQQKSEAVNSIDKREWYYDSDKNMNDPSAADYASGRTWVGETRRDTFIDKMAQSGHIKDRMRIIELYPDMHLPTLAELKHWRDYLEADKAADLLTEIGIEADKFPWTAEDWEKGIGIFVDEYGNILNEIPDDVTYGFADPDFFYGSILPTGKYYISSLTRCLLGDEADRVPGTTNEYRFDLHPDDDGESVKKYSEYYTKPENTPSATTSKKKPFTSIAVDRYGATAEVEFGGDITIYDTVEMGEEMKRYASLDPHFEEDVAATPDTQHYSTDSNIPSSIQPSNFKAGSAILNSLKSKLGNMGMTNPDYIDTAAARYRVPSAALANILSIEGGFNQKDTKTARETLGAYGPGQLTQIAVKELIREHESLSNKPSYEKRADPKGSVDMAAAYYRHIFDLVYDKARKGSGVGVLTTDEFEKRCWAYAAAAYNMWGLIGKLDRSSGIKDACLTMPEKVKDEPIKSRYQSTYNILNGNPSSIELSKADTYKPQTPASATNIDGRCVSMFLIGKRKTKTGDQYFNINIYYPYLERNTLIHNFVGGEAPGVFYFEQKTSTGMVARKLCVDNNGIGKDELHPDIDYYFVKVDAIDYATYMEDIQNKASWYINAHKLGLTKLNNAISDEAALGTPIINLKNIDGVNLERYQEAIDSKFIFNNSPRSYTCREMFVNEDIGSVGYHRDMFFDMREYSAVGRLAQAFPTYCVLIVDGGRWLRCWRIYDHLFGMMGIESVELFKSRKTPTDVANIKISNMFGMLSKQNFSNAVGKVYSWTIPFMFQAIADTFSQGITDETIRRWESSTNSLMLKAGARLHIRMGYSANANKLPILFNGVISEVTPGNDSIEAVALGDGYELEKKLQTDDSNKDSSTVYKATGFLGSATSAREIILHILAPGSTLGLFTAGSYGIDNKHGIEHFGTARYKFLHIDPSEQGMNVYNPTRAGIVNDQPSLATNAATNAFTGLNIFPGYSIIDDMHNETTLGIAIDQATAWDVFTTCRRAIPEFICAAYPFDLRSTLFYGKAYWPIRYGYKSTKYNAEYNSYGENDDLYAMLTNPPPSGSESQIEQYDPVKDDNMAMLDAVTDWKPFSQFKIISSSTNLISNSVKASDENVYTMCQAVGSFNGVLTKDHISNSLSSIMYLDSDIYPENQKLVYVNSGLYTTTLQNIVDGVGDIKPSEMTGLFSRKVSNTYAVNALKDSVMDMYKGFFMILGDPSIKPYDKIYVCDTYLNMAGLCSVKEVTHHFSIKTGMVSTVSPDLTASIADFADQLSWSWMEQFGARFAISTMSHKITSGIVKRVYSIEHLQKIISKLEKAVTAFEISNTYVVSQEEVTKFKDNAKLLFEVLKDQAAELTAATAKKATASSAEIDALVTAITKTLDEIGDMIERGTKLGVLNKHIFVPLAERIKKIRDGYAIEKDVAKGAELVEEAAKAGSVKEAKNILRGVKELEAVRYLSSASKMARMSFAIGKNLAYMAVVDGLVEWLNRKLAARQCLILQPLRINGMEFSAGIRGHMGCVVGDPVGTIDNFVQSFVNMKYSWGRLSNPNLQMSNYDRNYTIYRGIVGFGLALLGVEAVDYSRSTVKESFESELLGGTYSEKEINDRTSSIQAFLDARHSNSDLEGASTVMESQSSILGNSGKGFSVILKEPYKGDYGDGNCNRYAYDVLIKNGFTAPPRKPGYNTGEQGSERVGDLVNPNNKYVEYVVTKPTLKDIKPGMLLKFEPQHWAVVTENYMLNENLSGHVQIARSVLTAFRSGRITHAIMPKYRR